MPPRRHITPRMLAANRANARRSTGPRTAEGKARSRCNSLVHGLRARVVSLAQAEIGLRRALLAEAAGIVAAARHRHPGAEPPALPGRATMLAIIRYEAALHNRFFRTVDTLLQFQHRRSQRPRLHATVAHHPCISGHGPTPAAHAPVPPRAQPLAARSATLQTRRALFASFAPLRVLRAPKPLHAPNKNAPHEANLHPSLRSPPTPRAG